MSSKPETNPHFHPHGTTIRPQPPPQSRQKKQRPLPPYPPTPHFPLHEPPHYPYPDHHPQFLPTSSNHPMPTSPGGTFQVENYSPTSHFPVHEPPHHPHSQPPPAASAQSKPTRPGKNKPAKPAKNHHQEPGGTFQAENYSPTSHFPVHEPPHHHHSQQPAAASAHPTPTRPGKHKPAKQAKHHRREHSPQPTPSSLRVPSPQRTRPHTWLIGAFCALFWLAIILGGLIILVIYVVFRPRGPKFDISNASLNAAYLDMGYLLNADVTILANFTNPSKRATVDFSHIELYLYYEKTLIATSYVNPFSALKAQARFREIHLVTSQVWLPAKDREKLGKQITNNRVRFEVEALLHTRSNLGTIFRYSYRLYGHCIIELTAPPSGVLVARQCKTKR